MGETRFTPGPWKVGVHRTNGVYQGDDALDGKLIASGSRLTRSDEENAANLALIAAAPETTECLRGWCLLHSDPEFAAKTDLEKAEIRTALWMSSVTALHNAGVNVSPQDVHNGETP